MNTIEKQLYSQLLEDGWTVLTKGWPDFIAHKNETLIAAEVKSSIREPLLKHQLKIMGLFQSAGIKCYRWSPDSELSECLQQKARKKTKTAKWLHYIQLLQQGKSKCGLPEKAERNRLLIERRKETGMTFQELGRLFNISRQKAHFIYRREEGRQIYAIDRGVDKE